VASDTGANFRLLQLDVWVASDTPENTAKLNSRKKMMVDAVKEEFKGHNWTEFTDPANGVDVARGLLKSGIAKVSQGVPITDVLIESMILR
jgi:hypothetical protein